MLRVGLVFLFIGVASELLGGWRFRHLLDPRSALSRFEDAKDVIGRMSLYVGVTLAVLGAGLALV